jgi:hypothetical protein
MAGRHAGRADADRSGVEGWARRAPQTSLTLTQRRSSCDRQAASIT